MPIAKSRDMRHEFDPCPHTFLHIAQDLTREELEALIEKRPEVWGRYAGWLDRLPSVNKKK